MNARILRQIAGDEDAMCLAGDNLIVDLDLSEANLPAGSQLAIGSEVVIEITDLTHTGCSKFAQPLRGRSPRHSSTTSAANSSTSAAATPESSAAAPSASATKCANMRPSNAATNARPRPL